MLRFFKHTFFYVLISFFAFNLNAQNTSWKFIVVGDSRGDNNGVNAEILTNIRDAIISETPLFVLFNGDLITGGVSEPNTINELKYWQKIFMEPLLNRHIKVYPVPGNHDVAKSDKPFSAWDKVFTGKFALPENGPEGEKGQTYSLLYKNTLIVGMNTYAPGHEHRINRSWFESQLSSSYNRLFVFAHDPAYALSGAEAHKDGLSSFPDERNLMIFNIIAHNGKCYFAGHDHWYDHAKVSPTRASTIDQFIVGTAGAPLRKWAGTYTNSFVTPVAHFDDFGYMVVTVSSNSVICDMKRRTGPGTFVSADVTKY